MRKNAEKVKVITTAIPKTYANQGIVSTEDSCLNAVLGFLFCPGSTLTLFPCIAYTDMGSILKTLDLS